MAQGGPCIGPCNSRYREAQEAFRKALDAYDPLDPDQQRPVPPDVHPWPGEPTWCGRCGSRIRQCLHELDDAASLLAAEADGLRGDPGEQRVAGSKEHASPSPAGDDLEELVTMLAGWESAYRDLKEWPSPARRGFLASRVTSVCAWLMLHLDGILITDLAGDFGTEVLGWHREFVGKARAGARKLRKPLRCPSCHLLLLTWTEGERYVQCANPDCGRMMSLAEYEAEVSLRAGEGGSIRAGRVSAA